MYWISLFHRLSHFFLSQTRSKSYKKVHNDISSNTRNKKGFLPFNINLSKYYFVSLVSVLGQKNHKNLLKKRIQFTAAKLCYHKIKIKKLIPNCMECNYLTNIIFVKQISTQMHQIIPR